MYTVYLHINKENNKKYFGQTMQKVTTRWGNGSTYRSSHKFYNAIQKYGWDGFNHFIIREGLTKDEANELEMKLIEKYNTTVDGYNITAGGDGVMHNRQHNDTTKNNISKKRKEQVFSEESQLKKMDTMYGFKFNGIICTNKSGESFYYRTVREFCVEHNGDSGHVNKVLRGKRQTHKGFSITFA